MKTSITMAAVAALLALSVPRAASATPGVSIDSARLAPQPRTELRASIDKARLADPAAFRDVREILAHARETDKRARGRKAPLAAHLANLGTRSLLPLLELLAFDAPPLAPGETTRDRAVLERDIVEATGLPHDVRATPVLLALLARDADFQTTRTTAEAVGRLETPEAASALVSSANSAVGERATAIFAGMGWCHRTAVAQALAARLASHPDEALAAHLVKSLGRAGNAWAWKTLADRTEESAARETAARALVAAYVYYTGDVREAAAKALLVVDDSHAEALLQAARRGASPDAAAAIDDLARRLAENPTH